MNIIDGLPSYWYYSQEHYKKEIERLMTSNWLFVGHAKEFDEEINFKTIKIANWPLLIIKSDDTFKAFKNLCPHRGATLINKKYGKINKTISCPYHSWKFDKDGKILGSHRFHSCQDLNLGEVFLKNVNGFLFVCLYEKEFPLNQEVLLKSLDLTNFTFRESRSVIGNFNWKLWIEGFQECYHCPSIHRNLAKEFQLSKYMVVNHETYSQHFCQRKKTLGADTGSDNGKWFWVYPNLGLPFYEKISYCLVANPISENKTELQYSFFSKNNCSEEEYQVFIDFFTDLTQEDVNICEDVQKNLEAGWLNNTKVNTKSETGVVQFHSLLQKDMALYSVHNKIFSEEEEIPPLVI